MKEAKHGGKEKGLRDGVPEDGGRVRVLAGDSGRARQWKARKKCHPHTSANNPTNGIIILAFELAF